MSTTSHWLHSITQRPPHWSRSTTLPAAATHDGNRSNPSTVLSSSHSSTYQLQRTLSMQSAGSQSSCSSSTTRQSLIPSIVTASTQHHWYNSSTQLTPSSVYCPLSSTGNAPLQNNSTILNTTGAYSRQLKEEADRTIDKYLSSCDFPEKVPAVPFLPHPHHFKERLLSEDPELSRLIDSFSAVSTIDSNHHHQQANLNTAGGAGYTPRPIHQTPVLVSPSHKPTTYHLLTVPEQAHYPPPPSTLKSPERLPCAHMEQAMRVRQSTSVMSTSYPFSMVTTGQLPLTVGGMRTLTHEPSYHLLSVETTTPLKHLTEESYYLSQPYHIGIPASKDMNHDMLPPPYPLSAPSTTTIIPHSLPTHQVMCPVHNRVFDSSLYCTPNPSMYNYDTVPVTHSQYHHHVDSVPCTVVVTSREGSVSSQKSCTVVFCSTSSVTMPGTSSCSSSATRISIDSSAAQPLLWPRPPSPVSVPLNPRPSNKSRKAQNTAKGEVDPKEKALEFAKNFRMKRLQLDFSPEGVAQQVNLRFGSTVIPPLCGNVVTMYEEGQLSLDDMFKMKNYLENWLVDIERARGVPLEKAKELAQSVIYKKDRKKRAFIDGYQRYKLEMEFQKNNRPNRNQIKEIARNLGSAILDHDTVRIWFCNRRNKQKLELSEGGASKGTGCTEDQSLEDTDQEEDEEDPGSPLDIRS